MQLNKLHNINIDGSKLRIAIVLPYFNELIGMELLENCKYELLENKVKPENIITVRVAGALEIPFACREIIAKNKPDAIIALGVVVRGETYHFEMVTKTTYKGIMNVQLATGIPISFGVLTCDNINQAKERASATGQNKGKQAAQAALLQTRLIKP